MTRPLDSEPRHAEVLRALPAQLIEVEDGVILKRGATELRIGGGVASAAVRTLYDLAADGVSTDQLEEAFGGPAWPGVAGLIEQLRSRRFLVAENGGPPADPASEDGADVFYWQFGTTAAEVAERLTALRVAILGVNLVSRRLAAALVEAGAGSVEVVNYPLLCNLRLLDDAGALRPGEWPATIEEPVDYGQWADGAESSPPDILVATSDFGGRELMRQWNRFAVERDIHFLPVVLENLVGHVGPLVIPGEVACYECLRARENSNLDDPQLKRAAEPSAFAGQRVAALHPSMASIVGEVAAVELGRVYGRWSPAGAAGRVLEVNLISGSMQPRPLLKLPRCPVCGPVERSAPAATTRAEFRRGLALHQPHDHHT